MKLSKFLKNLECDSSGATAIEYGLILSMIVIAMLTAFQSVGDTTIGMWNRVSSTIIEATAN
jgi:pilus assembly protein Flp/PilA